MATTLQRPSHVVRYNVRVGSPPQKEDRRHSKVKKLLNAVVLGKTERLVTVGDRRRNLQRFGHEIIGSAMKEGGCFANDALAVSSVPC